MIDLSFLTEEEQEAIMKVLQRDAELKRAEEERVRHLPEKVKDDVQLKNMSGQWFYEAKSKRHRDKIHGADIIRASMRRKPATLAEMSQNRSNRAKNTWVSNVNREVFVPPELHDVVEHQEEQLKSSSSSKPITSLLDKPEERPMKAAVSPVKQRRNPFNSASSVDNLNTGEWENRPATLPPLSKKEILSLSEETQPKPNLPNDETEKHKKLSVEPTDESQKGLVKRPVPKARKLIHKATDSVSQREDFVPKPAKWTERMNGIGTPPRGILKRSSSSSSTDSEVRVGQMLDVQKKNGLPAATIFEGKAEKDSLMGESEDSTQVSLEKLRQVRFSSSSGKGESLQSPKLHHGRERGEFDLLESDEVKSSGSDAVGSDSFGNKQIPGVRPFATNSSALQIKPVDGLQEDTSASSPSDTNRSVFLDNENLQTKTVTPKKIATPQKTSSNILLDSNKELSVDDTRENKPNQILSHGSKSQKNFTDEHQLSAEREADVTSNMNSTSLQQGKPDLVEERDAKTPFKPDKHTDELVKVDDESVSKVLDWFTRSPDTEDRKHVSARCQGREPKEEVDFSSRTAVFPTEHSGPSMDGKTKVTEQLSFGKIKQNSISPISFISEDTQLMKEKMKPKKGDENEEQNDKSLSESDCMRVEERERGQEIEQQNQKSNFLEQQEHKLPSQKYQSEKAVREKRRMKEIRAFWERDKIIPGHGEKEVSINAKASGDVLRGLGENDKMNPIPNRLDDQSKNVSRSVEQSCASQASRNEHPNSAVFGPGHAVERIGRTFSPDEVHEYTELPKAGNNMEPSVDATSASPESKDKNEKEALKGKAGACSQKKPSFQILSLKEKMNEKFKNQIADPSQFQSLRNFWDSGVKMQSSIVRGDAPLPSNTSSVTDEGKSKEDKKGRDNVSKQNQKQTQTPEREKPQKLDPLVCELPLGSPAMKGLSVKHVKNTDSAQLDSRPAISKPQMGLPEQEVKECIEKSTVSPKEHRVSLQLLQSPGDKSALKEKAVDDQLCSPGEKLKNEAVPLSVCLPKEEVTETVDKVVLPKPELDVFKLGLKKLEKEASETSTSWNLKENISKETTSHSESTVKQSCDISLADQKEEIGRSTGKMTVPSTDERETKGLRKLFREFEPFYLRHQAADKGDSLEGSQRPQAGLQNLLRETSAAQSSECRREGMKTSSDTNGISQINCSVKSTCHEDTGQPEEISETTEKSVAPSKVSGLSCPLEKLMEASEPSPPKPGYAVNGVRRSAEVEVKSRTYQHDGELLQEIGESVEKSVAPSKVSGLSSGLEKLLEETSEKPPPKPKHADSVVQRTAEVEAKSRIYQHDGQLLQEIGETIEKSVAPSRNSGLSSAVEKLLEEASEKPPQKPKHANSIIQGTAEVEAKNSTCENDGELPQEVSETIEKSVAPSKVGGLSSTLEKLLEETSELPPSKPKCATSVVQRTAEVEAGNRIYGRDGELPQEISETIEKSLAPSRISGLSSALEKLMEEASEKPPPKPKHADSVVQRTAEVEAKSSTCENDGELPQEISETIEKSVAPSRNSGLSSAVEKLLEEASEKPPQKPKHANSIIQGTAEVEAKNSTCENDGELPQEVSETIEKSVAPSKVGGLSSTLEKLLEEASELPPSKPKCADNIIQGTAGMEAKSRSYEHDGELPQEIGETVERSGLSKAEYELFDINLQKLPKEVSETLASALQSVDKKMPGRIQASQSMLSPHRESGPLQEIQETIEKTSVSNTAKFCEFSSSLEQLLQEASGASSPIPKELHSNEKFGNHMFPPQKETLFMAMSQPYNALSSYLTQREIAVKGEAPEQNIKASVNEIEASVASKRNGANNKIEERNISPTDLPPLEGETNMIAIKPFMNEEGRRDKSTPLDASENNSEFKAPLKFRRTSTPLKDESNSSQPGGAQLCLMSQHEDNDQEEGASSNVGSKFSDKNSESHSGSRHSARSEEELNPVLMALKRSADRKMPSKSLEDIPSATSNKRKINKPKEELALSAEDGLKPEQHQERNQNAAGISTVPSQPEKLSSNPEKLKGLSKSVPSFLQEESDDRETDTASESSYSLGRIKKSPSSLTNLSGSSGMASLSSVSGSLMSIYSADFGNVDVQGNIQFAIDYVEQLNELHIFICQCKDLAVADVKRQRSDPYVKTYLLPEKYKLGKRKTSVKKKTLNPVYNEILRVFIELSLDMKYCMPEYKIEKSLLKNQSLNISVWHNDTFGRNSFLGEVELDLGTWDWNDKSNKQINWFPLKPRTSTMALPPERGRGEMKLALQYVPHPVGGKKTQYTGEVHIWVKECHDLPLLRGNRLNSFIKCTVLPDTSRKSRQKTRTVAKTTNPLFNHTMVYDGFRPEDLKEACIELTVWDHNKLANHFLGGLRIGLGTGKSYGTTVDWMDSTSDETALWEKMMKSPNTWIEDTLPLRMLMVAKLTK